MPRRRRARLPAIAIVLAAVLALGLAGCGSDDGPEPFESEGRDPATEPGDDATAGDGGEPGDGSGTDGDGGAGDGSTDGSSDGGSDGGGVDHDDHGPVGSLGPVLLDPSVSTAHLQVDHVDGVDLAARARDALLGALQRHGAKQVEARGGATLPGRDVWTTGDIRSAAGEHRAVDARGDVAAVQVLVLDGRHEDDSVLGIAVDASTFALFPEQMRGDVVTDAAFGSDEIQEAVAVHELGHLFGLVNLSGHGEFHEDPEHPGHSTNEGSVMHWAVETDAISRVFEGGPPTTFDADDEEEMSRIRG